MSDVSAILENAGYPTDVLVFDFESFFSKDFSLKKLSTAEYVADPRFEVVALAVKAGDGDAALLRGPHVGEFLVDIDWHKTTAVAHNATFDATILTHHYDIAPPFLIDTLGLARHYNARARNDLASIAKRWGLEAKGDTSQFLGLRPADMTPDQWEAMREYACQDVILEWQLFERLLPYLSNPRVELPIMQKTIEMFTCPTLRVDRDFGGPLITEMARRCDEVVAASGYERKAISGNKSFAAALEARLELCGETLPMKQGKNGPIPALAKDDDGRAALLSHTDPEVRALMDARVAIKSWPLHIKRVERIIAQAYANGSGRLCVPLKYHGAHTGRWAGGEKINLQNLPARNKEDLVNSMRGLIVAPPSHSLVVVDASQIEARVLAWLAGQEDLLEQFATGADPYCAFASRVLGQPVRKVRDTDPAPVARLMKWGRALGKVGVLGCGYGMGAARAIDYSGGLLDAPMAKKLVETYRLANHHIVDYWYALETAFRNVVRYGTTETLGPLTFSMESEKVLALDLPSSRRLRYHDPRYKPALGQLSIEGPMGGHVRTRLWGGHIAENVVQAASRDLLCDAMLEAGRAGIHTALTVHDELVCVSPEVRAEHDLAIVIEFMADGPAWAAGCPLNAAGAIMQRYGK